MRKFVKVKTVAKEFKDHDSKIPVIAVYPSYSISGQDLMKKGGKFYAVYDYEKGMWTQDESRVSVLIDSEISNYISKNYQKDGYGFYRDKNGTVIHPEFLDDSSTNRLKEFNVWFSNLSPNHNYIQLDTEITFLSDKVTPEMYRSKRLKYDIKEGDTSAYDTLIGRLYSEEDRQKIEWCIGSILKGDSKKIEKLLVFYGKPGSGKSTILDLIKDLLKCCDKDSWYFEPFVASELVSKAHQFSTASFKDNPLVAIQDDGSLEKIETPVINEIVSHKEVVINEKGKQQYTIHSNTFLILATNDPVDIHDTKLGITRRLLDVYPTGNKFPVEEYDILRSRLSFEIPAIAYKCLKVYEGLGARYYEYYIPSTMIFKTNYLQNFLFDNLETYQKRAFITRNELYEDYKQYCDDSGLGFPPKRISFGEQIKDYFEEYYPLKWVGNGSMRHVFVGLKTNKIIGAEEKLSEIKDDFWLKLDSTASRFDMEFADCPAQYAKEDGSPKLRWSDVKTTLAEIDTSKLHWLKLPETIIKVDFDKKDKDGNKSLEENIKAASSFPKTYAEVSKSGCGIHLYYIYDGDVAELSRVYDENIEVKVSTGNNSHRRIFTKCNNLPIATISCGLPLKGGKPEKDIEIPCTVAGLKTTIEKCLAKQVHADTTSNIDWIYKVLEQAYNSGLQYDLEDEFKERVRKFAEGSSHQSERCLKKFQDMKFKSKDYKKKGEEQLLDQDYILRDQEIRGAINLDMCYKHDFEPEMDVLKRVYETLDHYYTGYKVYGRKYDVSDMRQELLEFAMNAKESNPKECVDFIGSFKFASDGDDILEINHERSDYSDDSPIIFFDFEVFPNLVLICWKYAGENEPVHKVFNPTPQDIGIIFGIGQDKKPKAIGFNNKEYDNHIAYAIWMGKTTYEVFMLSQAIINNEKSAKYREAKNLSYTDIFDYSPEKISLKKWEIRLKIHHQELGLKWDEPVDEKWWDLVAEYCCNDVIATEAVFNETQSYFKGRLILCDLANIIMGPGSTPNDSTNELTTKLIVGNERNPQRYFIYPDLSKEFPGYEYDPRGIDKSRYISPDVIISGKSIYKGYDPGEGGFVWAQHGAHGMTESWDSSSHHPSSLNAENGFGKFTPNFKMLLELRLMVKHKEYDKLRQLYNGALAKYLESDEDAKALSFALKIAINSVYGLTAARFPNRLRDPRNVDNWVAKRGALFMIDLMLNVRAMGYKVIHCKTDSIKIVNPDDKVRNYIRDFGKQYGYTFELEHRFDRICLVNDAVYICKYADDDCNDPDERGKWDATGKQFQVPYVFKTLFSHEKIEFDDMCEMRSSSTALYLDLNENLPEGEHDYQFVGKTGLFCPMKPGTGGGRLLREKNGKYSSAESAKDYRWLEAEIVERLNKQDGIDKSYYISQVDKAVETISKFCDFEQFVSDAPFTNFEDFMNVPEGIDEEIPWD